MNSERTGFKKGLGHYNWLALGELFNPFMPQFPHLENADHITSWDISKLRYNMKKFSDSYTFYWLNTYFVICEKLLAYKLGIAL